MQFGFSIIGFGKLQTTMTSYDFLINMETNQLPFTRFHLNDQRLFSWLYPGDGIIKLRNAARGIA